MSTRNQIIEDVTDAYIESLDLDNLPSPRVIEDELVTAINDSISLANQIRPKSDRIRKLESLDHHSIAKLLLATNCIRRINCAKEDSDEEFDLLAIYKNEGYNEGTYRSENRDFFEIATQYNPRLNNKQLKDVIERLKTLAPRVERCMDRDLIAVNNGIFNYKTKELQDYTPDLVFLSKSHVNYNHAAQNIVIHNDDDNSDWDVESWMKSLSDDPEIVDLLWQVLGAVVRPLVNWDKAAWLYSEQGSNGKGTLCELMRELVGPSACASISLSSFSKEFALEPLIRAVAVIVDENDVGTFIDKAANLKAIVTHDVLEINRKHQAIVNYRPQLFMLQTLNEFPRIKDKSDSFYRRQLFIPFTKCFTGQERKYIKSDYLHRKEVLEYCLYKVLHMNYYELSEPEACKKVLATYKVSNDPVRQFWNDLKDEFKWDLLPYSFLYDLYKSWFRKNNPNGSVEGRNKFISEIRNIADGDEWEAKETDERVRIENRMNVPELLIAEYDLVEWKNPGYMGGDPNQVCTPKLSDSYAGLVRRKKTCSN